VTASGRKFRLHILMKTKGATMSELDTPERGLTELHQVKADVLAAVRPLRELTLDTDGLKKVSDGRKAAMRMRTSVDKRRKALNDEAQKWIKNVNDTAKEILAIVEPVELHLKGQEALHEERQRQAEEAERLERVNVRRAAWPADAGTFPESDAATRSAVDWQVLVTERQKAEVARREEAERREAERQELEKLRREKAEAEQRFAEQLRQEREAKLAAEREAERLRQEQAEAEGQKMFAALAERLEAERAASLKAALDKRAKLWDEHEAEPVPVAEMAPPYQGEIIGIWTAQPKQVRSVESRLAGLVESVMEIISMDGQPDWRGLLAEALEDARQ
jgi:hypothetical protein